VRLIGTFGRTVGALLGDSLGIWDSLGSTLSVGIGDSLGSTLSVGADSDGFIEFTSTS